MPADNATPEFPGASEDAMANRDSPRDNLKEIHEECFGKWDWYIRERAKNWAHKFYPGLSDSTAAFALILTKYEAIIRDARKSAFSRATEISKNHRQELFEDGLSADLEDNTKEEAFILGMEQELESITRKLMQERDGQ